MRIKSSIGLAVGPVDATHWGQVLVLPSVYGVVEIQDPAGNAQEEGVATLSLLGDALSHEISSLRALEDIADRANSPHVQSMMLLLSVGRVVYIVFRGKGNVYLKRGRELASLMHRDGGISGEVRSGDTFLLSSGGFASILPHEELTHLFDHLPAPEIAEKLTLLLHEKKGGEGSVALVFEAVDLEENQLKD